MVWVIIAAALIGTLIFFSRAKTSPPMLDVRQNVRAAKARFADLPVEERVNLSLELRATALDGYDRIHEAAKSAGKDEMFAHQAGTLNALSTVMAPGRELSATERTDLQMETAPFNKVPPSEGRIAIAEYAVWKFFPMEGDETLFAAVLRGFREEVFNDNDLSDDVIYGLFHSKEYDWQQWLLDNKDNHEST